MDREMQREAARFTLMLQVFELPGWTEIVKELESEIETIKNQMASESDTDEIFRQQGRITQCLQTIFLPDTVGNILDGISNMEDDNHADV